MTLFVYCRMCCKKYADDLANDNFVYRKRGPFLFEKYKNTGKIASYLLCKYCHSAMVEKVPNPSWTA